MILLSAFSRTTGKQPWSPGSPSCAVRVPRCVPQPSQGCWEDGSEVPAVSWALGQALLSLLQLPVQEVKSLCVNKAQGQQMPECQPRRSQPGLLQGIKHSFEAALGQGQTPCILTKLVLQEVQQRQHRRKDLSVQPGLRKSHHFYCS